MKVEEKKARLKELEDQVFEFRSHHGGGADRETVGRLWREINKLRRETGSKKKHCIYLTQCSELVTELHFKACCWNNPNLCPFLEMFADGRPPMNWYEILISKKTKKSGESFEQ